MSPQNPRPPSLRVALLQSVRRVGPSTDQRYGRFLLPRIAEYEDVLLWLDLTKLDFLLHVAGRVVRRIARGFGRRSASKAPVVVARHRPADVAFGYGVRPLWPTRCPFVYWETFCPSFPPYEHDDASLRAYREKHREAVGMAKIVMTPLETSAEAFRALFPDRAGDVRTVPFFLPQLATILESKRPDPECRAVKFLFLGSDARRKGLPVALRAWGSLTEAERAGATLHVISAFADGAVAIPPTVTHEGFTNDPEGRMRAADVLVMPTRRESFGFVIVEAMASGMAIVTTDDPVRREICGPDAALYVPMDDADALRDALRRLATEPGLAASLGRAGRARVLERYAPSLVARAHVAAWREAL